MLQQSTALKHTQIARRFLQAATRYLDEGDLVQASEKLWGATAHAVKVYSMHRGWRHSKYAHLRRAMERMASENGDDYWVDAFRAAYQHHLNFYGDDMSAQDIDDDWLIVNGLVDRLLAAVWDSDE